jgi:hypothetical protein
MCLPCIGKRFIKRDLAANFYAVNRPDIIEIVEQHVSTIARPSDPFFIEGRDLVGRHQT